MRHIARVTRWDAIICLALPAGTLNPILGFVYLALSVYFTYFTGVWDGLMESPLERVLVGTLVVFVHLLVFQALVFVLVSLYVLLTPKMKRGVLGEHLFEIRDDGLFESTSFNETLQKWSSVSPVLHLLGRTFVRVGGSIWHIIPDRDFPDESVAAGFRNEIRRRAEA